MSWTTKQLEAIEKAIAEGTLTVRYDNKEVRYRSLDEMIRIRDMIRQELGMSEKSTRLKANFSKGFS